MSTARNFQMSQRGSGKGAGDGEKGGKSWPTLGRVEKPGTPLSTYHHPLPPRWYVSPSQALPHHHMHWQNPAFWSLILGFKAQLSIFWLSLKESHFSDPYGLHFLNSKMGISSSTAMRELNEIMYIKVLDK